MSAGLREALTINWWFWSGLAIGSAVFAAGKRCDRTWPFWAAGSFDATSGMWQSVHFCGVAG